MSSKTTTIILIVCAAILLSVFLGLFFTGMLIGWGPFQGLYWSQERKRIKSSYPYEKYQGGIVFYGASNFRLWKTMEEDMSDYNVANCGFGGSTDKLMLEYADELLYPYAPKIIFLQTGSNDYVSMKGSDEEKIAACLEYKKAMYEEFHKNCPDAKIVVMSGLLLPGRSEYTELTIKVNDALEEYCGSVDYLYFVDADAMTYNGEVYADELFAEDGIHLNHDGQIRWMNDYILPMLESIIEEYGIQGVKK